LAVRVFKTADFARFARKHGIVDEELSKTVERATLGLIDANLGGGLIKQRVARPGQGRSRGFRTIVAWRPHDRSIFVYGFAKSRRSNIGDADLADLRDLARLLLGLSVKQLDEAVAAGELVEVTYNG
jgi:hypothetical protein